MLASRKYPTEPPRPKGPPRPSRSIADAAQLAGLPTEMTDAARWVCWKYVLRDAHWTKVPINAADPARNASSTDAATWSAFGIALAEYLRNPALAGIGFMLGEGFAGIDMDHVVDAARSLTPEAARIVELAGSYAELSPSGTGVHILLKSSAPIQSRRRGNVEVYAVGRYFTVTGRQI